jgi:LysR family transcriptional regulator, nitrogen assimilation regulatory protein
MVTDGRPIQHRCFHVIANNPSEKALERAYIFSTGTYDSYQDKMELRQLRYFVAIVEMGSLSKAAHAVHVSQSALSFQIARLEEELNTQLLSRSSRGVSPTMAGVEFCQHARSVLQQICLMKNSMPTLANQFQGTMTIGLPVTVAQAICVEFVKAVNKKHPSVILRIVEYPSSYLAELLVNHRVDLALLFMEDLARGIEAVPLLLEDFYLVGFSSKDVRSGDALTLLRDRPLVLPPLPNNVRVMVEHACKASGIHINVVAEGSNPQTLLRLVRAGIGGTVLPLSALMPDDIQGAVPLRIEPPLFRKLAICVAVDIPQAPLNRAVRAILIEVVDELVARDAWPGAKPCPLREH